MEKIRFQKNSDEMMRVISEQKKSLYLKAYVGSVYKDGIWRKMPEGQDPLQWFLTTSRTGNQMLYVSAAVEAFRAHGIPARYVEGYYLGASKIQDSKNGEVSITGENAHAWVEVYFDGVGWKTKEMDQKITDNFANIEAGEYERACELVEKTIYGEIKLELFEERTARNFRDKLAEEAKGLAWKEKLKLRYQFQKYCM